MEIDHIFIFTNTNGKIADELISFGLTPNDSRVHQQQGTSNRTFSFENFFLEIAWVHNEQEIKSELVKPTGLWQRSEYFKNKYSPFGLIIINNEDSDNLFRKAIKYQPTYFPEGMAFDILQNEHHPDLPWMGRMPYNKEKTIVNKNINHKNQINLLSKATFAYSENCDENFLYQFKNEKTIQFVKSDNAWLTLMFDEGKQGLNKIFEALQLTIEY